MLNLSDPFSLLSLPAAPHFPEPLGDVVVEVGEPLRLLCRAEGSPAPRVSWSRQDGKPVPGWHEPHGVSSQLEAAELLMDSKSQGHILWHPAWVMLTRCHPRVFSPCLLQAAVPALGLAPARTLSVVVKHGHSGFIGTFDSCKLNSLQAFSVAGLLHWR